VRQVWYCEGCDVQGSCTIPRGTDVYGGVEILRRSHDKKSPGCPTQQLAKLRIKAPGCSAAEWKAVMERGASA
jgi:hypothetical protein